jgi:Transposase/Na+-translocating membrane potential-generating system (MpsC)
MNYVGIDWAYRRAAWCAVNEAGAINGEGMIPADEGGLAGLVLELGTEVKGCVEAMSGAVCVKDRLEAAGWSVDVANARKVRDVAPLACKTDKVDARVLAELCRRDLVPAVWVASLEDRAISERLRRRAHLVKPRTSARNRIFGLLTHLIARQPRERREGPKWPTTRSPVFNVPAAVVRIEASSGGNLTFHGRADEAARWTWSNPCPDHNRARSRSGHVRGLLTEGERTLVRNGHRENVAAMRRGYQEVMEAEASELVGEITGRKVSRFMSANHLDDPDFAAEVFVLEPDRGFAAPPEEAEHRVE